MSDASYWCEHCERFVICATSNVRVKKLILSLLLCPVGFCLVPFLHPRFSAHLTCPICKAIIDDGITTCG